jgi:hypothetical protein
MACHCDRLAITMPGGVQALLEALSRDDDTLDINLCRSVLTPWLALGNSLISISVLY